MSNLSNLTITEQALEKQILPKLPANDQTVIMRVYHAGMHMIFSSQTHEQMVQGFEQQMQQKQDIGSALGTDIANIMLVLFQQSKGTMPQGALIPAGTLLLAKVCEFLNSTGTAQVTDAIFADATHLLASVLQSKFNQKFGQHVSGQAQPEQQSAQAAPQPSAQPSGMLAQGGV